jgi:SIR2-like domain
VLSNTPKKINWDLLLERIQNGKCTPFIGAGASIGVLPLGSKIAEDWANEYKYPLQDSHDLARVAQFLAVQYGDFMFPKEKIIKKLFRKPSDPEEPIEPPDFTEYDEPHAVLADLPLPIYITTNYDNFMMQALSQRRLRKSPEWALCRWNKYIKDKPSIFDKKGFEPTEKNPVVFHLHGHESVDQSLVLTEDDYLDFLISISKDQDLIPSRIQRAFSGTSLLFLGYSLSDWDFRVLYRSLVFYLERACKRTHVSVQIVPDEIASEEQKEQVRNYLEEYFGGLDIRVYWGTCREFSAELRRRWENL